MAKTNIPKIDVIVEIMMCIIKRFSEVSKGTVLTVKLSGSSSRAIFAKCCKEHNAPDLLIGPQPASIIHAMFAKLVSVAAKHGYYAEAVFATGRKKYIFDRKFIDMLLNNDEFRRTIIEELMSE